jgi:hypothetical protein
MPARIDSSGKPGIGGSAKGVETELVACVVVVVGVFSTVSVATVVLIIVDGKVLVLEVLAVVDELLAVVDGVLVLEVLAIVDELLAVADELGDVTDVLLVVEVALGVVVMMFVIVVCGRTVFWNEPGGSRCRINASEVVGNPVTVVPTTKPFVLDLKKRDWNVPPFGIAGVKDVSVQLVPS